MDPLAELRQVARLGAALAAVPLRPVGRAAEAAAFAALDAVLSSKLVEEAIDRTIASALAEHAVNTVLDERRIIDETVARLLDSEEVWLLIERIAQSPAVTEAIAHQSVGFADQVADGLRARTRNADLWLERTARRALRRQPRPEPLPRETSPDALPREPRPDLRAT